ncbi:hypothetical protein MMC16_000162 [Acarospora aff. strigata]|nr:hypothetical protein [Acarospora aff. strigata]
MTSQEGLAFPDFLIQSSKLPDPIDRSSAPNSLSIWTHHIQGISFHDSFVPKHCKTCKPTPAATIQAGMRMSEINAESAKLGVVVVGGADAGVGIGGFITGGGHSPISSKYGLGADQVLEFQVVTATGAILTVNECQHSDLFWALRGVCPELSRYTAPVLTGETQGGGSTFAVIISATVKTYPSPAITSYVFAINTTADSDAFADAHAYFHSQLPRLSEGGMMGYYYGLPNVGESEPDVTKRAKILGAFILLDQPASDAERLTRPMVEYYQNHTSSGAEITMSGYIQSFPDFYSWWVTNPPGAVGTSGRLGSRLLGGEALTGNQTALKRALRLSTPTPNVLLGHLVAGKGVREAKPAGGEDAVHPAWRKAYTHISTRTYSLH